MSQNRVEKNPPLLAKVKADLADQHIVAFLGPVQSGKTVMAALLNDALFKHFAPKHPDCYPNLTEGFEYLESVRTSIFAGKFPSHTPEGTKKPIDLKIRQEGVVTGHVTLRVYDVSGEDYRTLLTSEIPSAKDRLDDILRKHKDRSEPYGPLSFIAVATLYVLVVDCKAYSEWRLKDLEYANVLNSLSQLQDDENQSGLTTPLAIVLTKTDLLQDPDSEKSAKALIEHNMPQFHATLRTLHSGALEYFKFCIETDRDSSNEPQPDRIKVPLSYSNDEYVRFIGWVLKNA